MLTLTGDLCELGDIEEDVPGVRIKRADGSVVAVTGLTVEETRALVPEMFYQVVLAICPAGVPAVVPTHRFTDKQIEEIAGTDELTGDAILDFAHRLLNVAYGVNACAKGGAE
jgi:hypothetical protein